MLLKTNLKASFGLTLLVLATSAAAGARATAATLELQPGRYAVTITYEVQDQRQNQSQTATRCIRQRDLGSPETIFNDRIVAAATAECLVKHLKSTAGKISYDADCPNRTVRVEGNVSRTGFAVVRTVRPKASQQVSLKFTVSGRRTGDCVVAGSASMRPHGRSHNETLISSSECCFQVSDCRRESSDSSSGVQHGTRTEGT